MLASRDDVDLCIFTMGILFLLTIRNAFFLNAYFQKPGLVKCEAESENHLYKPDPTERTFVKFSWYPTVPPDFLCLY